MSDPMFELVRQKKQLTKVRNKSDELYLQIGRVEFEGLLYLDEETGLPCIPAMNWRGFFVSTGGASKKFKEGPLAKAGLLVRGNSLLEYEGPKDVEGMWEAGFYRVEMMKQRTDRVRKVRPQFPKGWESHPVFEIDEEVIPDGENTVLKWMYYGGSRVGLMGWRPTFGRFEVLSYEVL